MRPFDWLPGPVASVHDRSSNTNALLATLMRLPPPSKASGGIWKRNGGHHPRDCDTVRAYQNPRSTPIATPRLESTWRERITLASSLSDSQFAAFLSTTSTPVSV